MSRTNGFSFWIVMVMVTGLTDMLAPESASAVPERVYVDDDCGLIQDGSAQNPFCKIQDGIDAAADGEVVWVLEGIYTGPGNRYLNWDGDPDRNIRVIGAKGAGKTIIDLADSGLQAFTIQDSGVTDESTIEGFTISGGTGGAIFIRYASPQILGCRFKSNSADKGGAIYLADCANPVSIIGCSFDKNKASYGSNIGEGGAIYASHVTLNVTKCTFQWNIALRTGGAIYMTGSSATLTGCALAWNRTLDPNGAGAGGGAIFSDPDDPDHVLTIVDSTISNNSTTAETGGGIAFRASGFSGSTMLSLDRCQIIGNACGASSKGFGGGIFVNSCNNSPITGIEPLTKIDNCIIAENVATSYSTGPCGPGSCRAVGGGIHSSVCMSGVVEIEICNSTIANNRVQRNTTDAEASGGGLYVENHDATLHNAIFWGNESVESNGQPTYGDGTQIAFTGTTLTVGFSDVQDAGFHTDCDMIGNGVWLDTGSDADCYGVNIELDPLFIIDPPYHIDNTSPCYNRGADACGNYDIDFDGRVLCGPPDMGADEVTDCAAP